MQLRTQAALPLSINSSHSRLQERTLFFWRRKRGDTQGRLNSVADFENIVVRTNPDGSVLRLRDVARVELGAANLDRDTRLKGGRPQRWRFIRHRAPTRSPRSSKCETG